MKFVRIFSLFIIVSIFIQFSVDARRKSSHSNVVTNKSTKSGTTTNERTKRINDKNPTTNVNGSNVSKKRESETFKGGMSGGGSRGGFSGGMRGGYSGGMRGGYSGGRNSGFPNYTYSRPSSYSTATGYNGRSYMSNSSRGNIIRRRPYFGYGGRYGGFGSNYWWPWYRPSWLRGIRHYPVTYVRKNTRSCQSICRNLVFNCITFDVDHDEDGNLKCKCTDNSNDEETIFDKWCWTPSKCVKARRGSCQPIMNRIKSRMLEEEEKRR